MKGIGAAGDEALLDTESGIDIVVAGRWRRKGAAAEVVIEDGDLVAEMWRVLGIEGVAEAVEIGV